MAAGLVVHLNVTCHGSCLLQGKEWMIQQKGPCESCVFELVYVIGPHRVNTKYCFLATNGYFLIKVKLNSTAFRVISRRLRWSHLNSAQCSGETLCH